MDSEFKSLSSCRGEQLAFSGRHSSIPLARVCACTQEQAGGETCAAEPFASRSQHPLTGSLTCVPASLAPRFTLCMCVRVFEPHTSSACHSGIAHPDCVILQRRKMKLSKSQRQALEKREREAAKAYQQSCLLLHDPRPFSRLEFDPRSCPSR